MKEILEKRGATPLLAYRSKLKGENHG